GMYTGFLRSFFFFFSSRRRHTRFSRDWSSDVCSSDLGRVVAAKRVMIVERRGPAECELKQEGWRAAWEIKTRLRKNRTSVANLIGRSDGLCRRNSLR